jgi:type II restriction enzyme
VARTPRQELGENGERLIAFRCACPKCKRSKTLKRLPPNFKCADLICDFCGYLAQVKAVSVKDVEKLPDTILGAAWGPQRDRMESSIYFPLFLVLISGTDTAIYYLSADMQSRDMFVPRKPLSEMARRAGWRGFRYDLRSAKKMLVRIK